MKQLYEKFSEPLSLFEYSPLYQRGTKALGQTVRNVDRAFLYLKASNELGLYYAPHPTRDKYISQTVYNNIESSDKKIIEYFDNRICTSEFGNFANIDLRIPPILEHVISFAKKNKKNLSDSILEIRNSKNAIAFRNYCSSLDKELLRHSPRKKIHIYQSLFKDIDQLSAKWKDDLREGVAYKQRRINMTKIFGLGRIFDILGIKEISIKDPIILKEKKHLLFINDLYRS